MTTETTSDRATWLAMHGTDDIALAMWLAERKIKSAAIVGPWAPLRRADMAMVLQGMPIDRLRRMAIIELARAIHRDTTGWTLDRAAAERVYREELDALRSLTAEQQTAAIAWSFSDPAIPDGQKSLSALGRSGRRPEDVQINSDGAISTPNLDPWMDMRIYTGTVI